MESLLVITLPCYLRSFFLLHQWSLESIKINDTWKFLPNKNKTKGEEKSIQEDVRPGSLEQPHTDKHRYSLRPRRAWIFERQNRNRLGANIPSSVISPLSTLYSGGMSSSSPFAIPAEELSKDASVMEVELLHDPNGLGTFFVRESGRHLATTRS